MLPKVVTARTGVSVAEICVVDESQGIKLDWPLAFGNRCIRELRQGSVDFLE